jgi:tyramine---L-glutamate ligase
MRIAVFEWLCGGGMHSQSPEDVPPSLMIEGWAMLFTLAKQLHTAGHEVVSVIDHRLVTPSQISSLPVVYPMRLADYSKSLRSSDAQYTIDSWLNCIVESRAEIALIIAPEIDGILQQVIAAFQDRRVPTLNCSGEFLDRSCDKWLTAVALLDSTVPHPPTLLATDWSIGTADNAGQRWCLKSRLGAGCEGMWIGAARDLAPKIEQLPDPDHWIVQPWLDGEAFSCSAIVDHRGNATWLPLVTQSFEMQATELSQTLHYLGGRIVDPSSGPPRPDELLRDLLAILARDNGEALGWIGVDLLLQPSGRWIVIEVNPRLTTSVLGLCQAAPNNLAQWMIDAYTGVESPSTQVAHTLAWRSVEFTPACHK